ncbi:MAG: response regulator [Nitrospira sp.]|nr:response regulator [Nitrospira sp.]
MPMHEPEPSVATILVIDDEAPIRRMLRDLLEGAGHTVTEAADGRAAMKCLREQPSDLIITDMLMPEEDGVEVIREARRIAPETKIIAMSGGGLKGKADFLNIARCLGAQRTIAKPFALDKFLEAVKEVLQDNGPPSPAQ